MSGPFHDDDGGNTYGKSEHDERTTAGMGIDLAVYKPESISTRNALII